MNQSKKQRAALVLPLISGTCWGSVACFVRPLYAGGLDNGTILFARFGIATLMILVYILITNRDLLKIRLRDIWIFLVVGAVGSAGLNACYNVAIEHVTVGLAAVLLSLFSIFSIFTARIFFKEPITKRKLICAAAAIFGVVLVSGVLELPMGMTLSLLGVVAGIFAAVFYAANVTAQRVGTGKGYDSFTIHFYGFLSASIVLIPFTNFGQIGTYVAAAPASHIVFLLFHSLITSVAPYVIFTHSLKYVELGTATVISTIEPVAAMVLAAIVFHEIPSFLMMLGMAIAFIALAVLCMPPRKKKAKDGSSALSPEPEG